MNPSSPLRFPHGSRRAALGAVGLACAALLSACVVAPPRARVVETVQLRVGTPPPPLRVEVQPAPPAPQWYWHPGHWRWDGRAYYWEAGHWVEPRANQIFVPARWVADRGAWVYEPAHWVAGSR